MNCYEVMAGEWLPRDSTASRPGLLGGLAASSISSAIELAGESPRSLVLASYVLRIPVFVSARFRTPSERRPRQPQKPAWPTLKRAIGLMWPHRPYLAAYLVAIVFSSLIGLAPPLLIREIIDGAIPAA